MKTQEVIEGKRKMVSVNLSKEAYRKLRMLAAEHDKTMTAHLEHLILEDSRYCKHDKILA